MPLTLCSPPPRPPATGTDRRTIATVLILAIGASMQMLDSSILATALPQMAKAFQVSPTALGIGITSYIMATVIVLPASGWLADRIGGRRLLMFALLAFTAASVLCGASRTLPEFVAARVLQGLAGAFLGPVGSMMMMQTVERRDMVRMVNLFSTPILIAPVLGPPIGGMLTTLFGWSWIFYVNVPVGLIGALLVLRCVPERRRAGKPLDLGGLLLNGAAMGLIVFGFGELGEGGAARAGGGAAIAAGLIATAFAVRHARRHRHPLLSLAPLSVPTFTLTGMVAMPLLRFPMSALPFALPIMLQVGFGRTALASGMLFLAHTAGDLVAKPFTGRAFARFGYRTVMLAGTVALAGGVAGCALFQPTTPFALGAAVLFATGVFRALINSGTGTLSYANITPDGMASATTLSLVVMQLVQAISVSLTVVVIDLAAAMRSDPAALVSAADCRAALVAMAAVGLIAIWPLLRLPRDAGAELSGHRTYDR